MFRSDILTSKLIVLVLLAASCQAQAADNAKYVFFFLGDGMSNSQIQITEAYLTTANGGSASSGRDLLNPDNRLHMTRLPVQGMQTTFSSNALITDSAAAVTAFATGAKTSSGVIDMDETQTRRLASIAELAHREGRKVGILSSVSLNHATPAGYYASVPSRNLTNSIAGQLASSGFEFFGGGGLLTPTAAAREGDTDQDAWKLLQEHGYTVLRDRDAILALRERTPDGKVVAINPELDADEAMPYAIDQPDTNLSLAEMTDVAIHALAQQDTGKGFFLMVEGGKIDWACHANDAVAVIHDVIDFDRAIGKALEFYDRHPDETLIVVTGDHETGGMTVGHATTAYGVHYERLLGQKHSFDHFATHQLADYKAAHATDYDWQQPDNLARAPQMLAFLKDQFGLDWTQLSDYQRQQLEFAFDQTMAKENGRSEEENKRVYGRYEPLIVTVTHLLNEQAGIGWTSYAHTGVPVPVFARGVGAERFTGFYDNTDIPRHILAAMGSDTTLPVIRD